MNYIIEIRAFYDLQTIKPLSTGQIALWYALMHINNKCAWEEWFSVANSTLQFFTGLSRKSIYNARNVLKQLGYIDFKEVGNGRASRYKLTTLSKTTQVATQVATQETTQETTQVATQETTQETTQVATQETTPLNKRNETKRNETKREGENRKRFTPPSTEDVNLYCREMGYGIDAESFVNFYTSKNWYVGKDKMADWKAAVRGWESRDKKKKQVQAPKNPFLEMLEVEDE